MPRTQFVNFFETLTHFPKHTSKALERQKRSGTTANLNLTMGNTGAWKTSKKHIGVEKESRESVVTVERKPAPKKLAEIYVETHFRKLKPRRKKVFSQKVRSKSVRKKKTKPRKTKMVCIEDLKQMSKKFIKFDEEGVGDFKTKAVLNPKGEVLDQTRGERDLKSAFRLAKASFKKKQEAARDTPPGSRAKLEETRRFEKHSTRKKIPVIHEEPQSLHFQSERLSPPFEKTAVFGEKLEVADLGAERLRAPEMPEGEVLVPSEELKRSLSGAQSETRIKKSSEIQFRTKLENIQNESEEGHPVHARPAEPNFLSEEGALKGHYNRVIDSQVSRGKASRPSGDARVSSDSRKAERTLELKKGPRDFEAKSEGTALPLRFIRTQEMKTARDWPQKPYSETRFALESRHRAGPGAGHNLTPPDITQTENSPKGSDITLTENLPIAPAQALHHSSYSNPELLRALESARDSSLDPGALAGEGCPQQRTDDKAVFYNLISSRSAKGRSRFAGNSFCPDTQSQMKPKSVQIESSLRPRNTLFQTEYVDEDPTPPAEPRSGEALRPGGRGQAVPFSESQKLKTKESLKFY